VIKVISHKGRFAATQSYLQCFPWAHHSPYRKQYLYRFSCFCTARSRRSL